MVLTVKLGADPCEAGTTSRSWFRGTGIPLAGSINGWSFLDGTGGFVWKSWKVGSGASLVAARPVGDWTTVERFGTWALVDDSFRSS